MSVTKIATLRPAGALGDQSDATFSSQLGPVAGSIAQGSLSVRAATLAAIAEPGLVAWIVIGVRVRLTGPVGVAMNFAIAWQDGGVDRSVAVADFIGAFGTLETATITARDLSAGADWTFAAAQALTQVGATCDYILTGGEVTRLQLDVAEVYVDLYGVPHPSRVFGVTAGAGVASAGGGSVIAGVTAGSLAGIASGGPALMQAVPGHEGWTP